MTDYGTERGSGHRNDAEKDSYGGLNSHTRYDDPYRMDDMPDDQMKDNTTTDPRSAFDPAHDEYMKDTLNDNYTLSHASPRWTNNRVNHNTPGRTARGVRRNSHQGYRGQAQEQPHYYAESDSANPHGGHDYYGGQADSAPAFDFNRDPDDYGLGYQQEDDEQLWNGPAYGAPVDYSHDYQDYSTADQAGPTYGSGSAYFEPLTQPSRRPTGGRSSWSNRARGLRVHHSHEFVPGKVFILDYPEPKGHGLGTTIYSGTADNIFRKDRRFVVVSTHRGHSECISIVTYGGRGCSKPGTHNEDHGMVYSGDVVPDLMKGEGTLGFRPVCMKPINPTEQLHKASRINYSKLHPIEHNFAVEFVGELEVSDVTIVREAVDQCRQEAYAMQFHNY